MGVFTRMSNMIKGKVNATLDNLENPIELLDQKIRDMEEQLSKAKTSSAEVIGNVKLIEKNMNEVKKLSDDLDGKVKLALSKGNEELAKEALRRKVEADKKYETLKQNHATASAQAEALKKNLAALEAELEKTKSYRDEAAARYSTAKASKKVNEVLSDVQTKSNTIQMDSIERKIAKEEAAAQGLGELRTGDDFDSQFEALNEVDLDAELEKYKSEQ
ncbi:MAG: PspA/IM30 family protein [Clostridium sp.]|jgi:phage shock protein A|nr:PspA/IM30 family protein [Clostridium sp.]